MAQLGKITGLYEISKKLNDQILKENLVLKRIQQREMLEKIKGNEVVKNAFQSFVATFFLVGLGIIAAVIAGYIVDKNFFTLLLSYCPGGIYEVAVIAIAFDLDPDFVSFHHIIRLLMILFIVPLILKLINKKGSSNS